MIDLILAFLPNSLLSLAIVAIGVAIIVGMSPRKGLGMIGTLLFWVIISPFVESFLASLPLWVTLTILLVLGIQALRIVLTFLLGEHAAGHVLGVMFVGAAQMVGRGLMIPFRLIRGAGKNILVRLR